MNENISLRAITAENYRDIIKLNVKPEQSHLVAPNLFTIAQMQFNFHKIALAIYLDEFPIGLIAYDLEDYDIWRLMIDEHYQGKGYGKEAMQRVIEILRFHGAFKEVRTSVVLQSQGALEFYKKLGFKPNGEVLSTHEGSSPEEIELIYSLT